MSINFNFQEYVSKSSGETTRKVLKKGSPPDVFDFYEGGGGIVKEVKKPFRQRLNEIVNTVTKVARKSMDIYTAVKRKDPVSIGLGVLSGYNVVSEVVEEYRKRNRPRTEIIDVHSHLLNKGYRADFSYMTQFIFRVLDILDIKKSKHPWTLEFDDAENLVIFNLDGLRVIYFEPVVVCSNNGFDKVGPYIEGGRSKEFLGKFSEAIKNGFGRAVGLGSVTVANDTRMVISPLDYDLSVYVSPINEKDLVERTLGICEDYSKNRSIIFTGMPGVGKTTMAFKIAKKLDGTLLTVSAKFLQTFNRIPLNKIIEIINPDVILLDDMDHISSNHLEIILSTVEEMNKENGTKNRIIIATVNNIKSLSPALRRPGRFDEAIEFCSPDVEQRGQIISGYANKFNIDFFENNSHMDKIVKETEGLSGAFIKEIVMRAKYSESVDDLANSIREMKRLQMDIDIVPKKFVPVKKPLKASIPIDAGTMVKIV